MSETKVARRFAIENGSVKKKSGPFVFCMTYIYAEHCIILLTIFNVGMFDFVKSSFNLFLLNKMYFIIVRERKMCLKYIVMFP